ncbi:MAG: ribonuclease HII [Lewinellaceae bacterium]|nr:ribonuclease HII [Saprospiraceae bacterium]MCB9312632.1 ribonuclease HII [Lewinellaceae bacterium]HRW76595.1 ribonuclease HII [Saprospiraceae bacterium]
MSLKACYLRGVSEAGCDEAGRGCLAGPVVAAAVILPAGWHHPLLNDSKQLSERDRNTLRPLIEQSALAWAVAMCTVEEIDQINILQASIQAMHRAIGKLDHQPDHLLIDGNRFKPYLGIPHTCIVGGDGLYRSIAAASVLAKTWRDEWMLRHHADFPHYGWQENKGYPTEVHRSALYEHGPSPHHRMTFKLDGITIRDRFPDGPRREALPSP